MSIRAPSLANSESPPSPAPSAILYLLPSILYPQSPLQSRLIIQILNYYSRFQSSRQSIAGLPAWGRFLIGLVAIPGIVLAALSLLALGVSILALLLLTVPVYRVVRWIAGEEPAEDPLEVMARSEVVVEENGEVFEEVRPQEPVNRPRRQIDVTIVE